jgi:hypothetical protein
MTLFEKAPTILKIHLNKEAAFADEKIITERTFSK